MTNDRRRRALRCRRRARLAATVLGLIAAAGHARADDGPQDLTRLSLEELAEVEITSASRRPEPLGQAATAIFVITAEDIRRSGVTSLAEALRLAPNLYVRRLNAGDYEITARGFNGFETANKLLVLVDGRSIYEPLHSGVLWDGRAMPVEIIERIEVISGPGGTLYGANAMNGVINIITRQAMAGGAVRAVAGDDERTLLVSHGVNLGETAAVSGYVSGFERDSNHLAGGALAGDRLQGLRAGFRSSAGGPENLLVLQGDAFDTDVMGDVEVTGANLLGRWRRSVGAGAFELQAYVDRTEREGPDARTRSDTLDLHMQHTLGEAGAHRLIWGGGFRWIDDSFRTTFTGAFLSPADRNIRLGHLFVQDQIALGQDLVLTAGVKLEHSSYTGEEILPSLRLAWRRQGHLIWRAGRARDRTPNRIDRDLLLPGILVPEDFQSESLLAYEVGYRGNPTPATSLSISAFYNDYSDLRTTSFASGGVPPLSFTNFGEGHTFGVEAWGGIDVTRRWRLSVGVATLDKHFSVAPGGTDFSGLSSTGEDPEFQVLLDSSADIGERVELDIRLRAVGEIEHFAGTDYMEADVRLGYRLGNGAVFSVVGSNLLDDDRRESHRAGALFLGRSVHAELRMDF